MRCPICAQNHEESMCFPANNLELSPKISGFYDEHGVHIELKPIARFYGCVNGHVFRLADIKTVNEETVSIV